MADDLKVSADERAARRSSKRNALKSAKGAGAASAKGSSGKFSAIASVDGAVRRKAMLGVYRVLTSGADSGDAKTVPGTPFTESGVANLRARLEGRAGKEVMGSRVARAVSKFLTASDGEEAVNGYSIAKLQKVAQLAEARRKRREEAQTA